jgi:hypothetical protein
MSRTFGRLANAARTTISAHQGEIRGDIAAADRAASATLWSCRPISRRCATREDLDDDHAIAAAWTSGLTEIDGGCGRLAF